MKNKFMLIASLSLVLFVALGCGLTGGFTGSDSSDSSSESSDSTAKSEESSTSDSKSDSKGNLVKVGIPECDEFATYINDHAEEIGKGSIVARGIVEMYKQTIFSNLKESVEKMDEKEKAKMAENCKKALENVKKQFDKKEG